MFRYEESIWACEGEIKNEDMISLEPCDASGIRPEASHGQINEHCRGGLRLALTHKGGSKFIPVYRI